MAMKLNLKKILLELQRLGWTKAEYARKIGISRQLMNHYLNQPLKSVRIVNRLAGPLHVDPRDLLI
jgi:hypothetical protein